MTIHFVEGFDHYPASVTAAGGLAQAWTLDLTSLFSFETGRFGVGRAVFNTAGTAITATRQLAAEQTTIAMGFALLTKDASVDSAAEIASLRSASGAQLVLGVTTGGQLVVGRGSFSNILGTEAAGNPITSDAYHYIEIEATIDGSSGSVKVYKNGAEVISVSGVNTKGQTEAGVDRVRIRWPNSVNWTSSDLRFDDLYVADAARGDSRVVTLLPNADTAEADWAPSTGMDHFAMVDDDQGDGDTTYVQASLAGDYDLYALSDLPVTPNFVHAVQVSVCARKTDATAREVRTKLKSGATTSNGATAALGSSYGYSRDIYSVNPDTATAWTESAVNALEAGQEVVS